MHLELVGRHPLLCGDLCIKDPGDQDELVVDAGRLAFADPLDLAAVAAVVHAFHANDARTALILPTRAEVTTYAQRMDLLQSLPVDTHVAGALPNGERTDRSGTLLEVTSLTPGTAAEVSEHIGRVATNHLGRHFGALAFKAVGELIDNAISHGLAAPGAFICAQAYSGRTTGYRRLEVAVCDTGVGVLEHLRRNPVHEQVADSRQALRSALRYGVSGTDEVRGNGLPDLLAETGGGLGTTRLVLRSGDGVIRAGRARRANRTRYKARSTTGGFGGTWAWLRVSFPV